MRPSEAHADEARTQRMQRPDLIVQALVATLFVVACAALVALGFEGPVDLVDLVLLVAVATVLGRLEFEIGSGFASPIQLVFIPMLFVLPPAIVPPAFAAALVLDRIPAVLTRRSHPQLLLTALGDAWFTIGPAIVFAVAGLDVPSLADWPVYLLALAAQFAGDLASSLVRMGLGRGIGRAQQLRSMGPRWLFDLLLSPIGLMAAYATREQDHAYLLVLPQAVLLKVFARERRDRISQAIELSAAYRGTALLLGDVIEGDDEYTGRHSQGVVVLAVAIADELRLGEDERRLVEFGAMLHDIGKISTPKEILNKPGPLDADERLAMQGHTVAGQAMLDRVGGILHEVGAVVRSSHERFDGGGYPDGLAGDAIARPARIIAVSDTYSAMTTSRPYRAALKHETALDELRANAGTQFDPRVVEAALAILAAPTPQPRRP
jgi:putative nucleotidyltransferase with HDIG domain